MPELHRRPDPRAWRGGGRCLRAVSRPCGGAGDSPDGNRLARRARPTGRHRAHRRRRPRRRLRDAAGMDFADASMARGGRCPRHCRGTCRGLVRSSRAIGLRSALACAVARRRGVARRAVRRRAPDRLSLRRNVRRVGDLRRERPRPALDCRRALQRRTPRRLHGHRCSGRGCRRGVPRRATGPRSVASCRGARHASRRRALAGMDAVRRADFAPAEPPCSDIPSTGGAPSAACRRGQRVYAVRSAPVGAALGARERRCRARRCGDAGIRPWNGSGALCRRRGGGLFHAAARALRTHRGGNPDRAGAGNGAARTPRVVGRSEGHYLRLLRNPETLRGSGRSGKPGITLPRPRTGRGRLRRRAAFASHHEGPLRVPLSRVTTKALYVNVPSADAALPAVQLIALRDGEGRARIAFNTCQACNPSPRAWFAQRDDGRIVCQNCGNDFGPEAVGAATRGCNPAPIPGVRETADAFLVPAAALDAARPAFIRWAGPRE